MNDSEFVLVIWISSAQSSQLGMRVHALGRGSLRRRLDAVLVLLDVADKDFP